MERTFRDDRIRIALIDPASLEVDALILLIDEEARNPAVAAIHAAAGPDLAAARSRFGRIPDHQSRATPGFALATRWVIHAAAPPVDAAGGARDLLARTIRNALVLAQNPTLAVRRIALPAIGERGTLSAQETAALLMAEADRAVARANGQQLATIIAADTDAYETLLAAAVAAFEPSSAGHTADPDRGDQSPESGSAGSA